MKVQKFTGLPRTNQVFKSHSKETRNNLNNKKIFDMDSVNGALATDSIDDPILPQIVRKFKETYNIFFPDKVVKEAENIKKQVDSLVDNHKFQAVA